MQFIALIFESTAKQKKNQQDVPIFRRCPECWDAANVLPERMKQQTQVTWSLNTPPPLPSLPCLCAARRGSKTRTKEKKNIQKYSNTHTHTHTPRRLAAKYTDEQTEKKKNKHPRTTVATHARKQTKKSNNKKQRNTSFSDSLPSRRQTPIPRGRVGSATGTGGRFYAPHTYTHALGGGGDFLSTTLGFASVSPL